MKKMVPLWTLLFAIGALAGSNIVWHYRAKQRVEAAIRHTTRELAFTRMVESDKNALDAIRKAEKAWRSVSESKIESEERSALFEAYYLTVKVEAVNEEYARAKEALDALDVPAVLMPSPESRPDLERLPPR